MRKDTRSWIAQADKDLGTADFASQSIDGPLPVTTGLRCQQSAEKYLKAFLLEHGVNFSRRHNLLPLLEACVSIDKSFEDLRREINQLESYSIASRYPIARGSLKFRTEALTTTKRVKEFVLSKLS